MENPTSKPKLHLNAPFKCPTHSTIKLDFCTLVRCFLYLTFLAFEREGCVNARVDTQISSFLLGLSFYYDGKIDSLDNVILRSCMFDYVVIYKHVQPSVGKSSIKKCLVVL